MDLIVVSIAETRSPQRIAEEKWKQTLRCSASAVYPARLGRDDAALETTKIKNTIFLFGSGLAAC